MSASYVIKTNARSALTRFTVSGLITDYIADPAKGPPGEVSKSLFYGSTHGFSKSDGVLFSIKNMTRGD